MKSKAIGVQILLGWVALVLVQMIIGMLVPVRMTPPPHAASWFLLSDLLIVTALGYVAAHSKLRGLRLGVALAAIPFGIAVVNLIEGAVFLSRQDADWGRIAINMLLSYALVSPLWAYIFRGQPAIESEAASGDEALGTRLWKFLVSDVTYLVLYYAAGSVIFPFVKGFYATQHVPRTGTIVALQLLIRGPVFVLICLGLLRMFHMPRLRAALMTGLVFTAVSGVAPLLIPNAFFPDYVRWVHMAEVTSSNFLFGAFVGWLWTVPRNAVVRPVLKAA
jgi:hypothetical protein